MKSLNGSEIDDYANDIYKILKEVPLFYLNEVLELAKEGREREGEIDKLDTDSSSDEEEEEERIESESEEEDSESSDDD